MQTLKKGRTEAWPFYYEYEVVPIDAGLSDRGHIELTRKLAARLGADIHQLPLVTVLDEHGKPVAHQLASAWVKAKKWDEQAIGAFLTEHKIAPQDAEQVLAQQLALAKKQDKRLIVHLGAPW